MGGAAPTVDGNGDIWVAVGNGSVHSASQPYDDSDSALELSPSLQLLQYFAPTTWPQNNAHDLDMSMAPALLADGQVVLAGKSRIVYLLDGAHLGGIGGQEASLDAACSEDIDGGSAVVGTTVYLPCPTGPVAITVTASPASLSVQWTSRVAEARRLWLLAWCGPSGRTARSTDSTLPRERYASRCRSAYRRITSRRRASATDSSSHPLPTGSSPSVPRRRARRRRTRRHRARRRRRRARRPLRPPSPAAPRPARVGFGLGRRGQSGRSRRHCRRRCDRARWGGLGPFAPAPQGRRAVNPARRAVWGCAATPLGDGGGAGNECERSEGYACRWDRTRRVAAALEE